MRQDIVHAVLKGVAWSYLAFISGRLITFLATIVLARILAPEDFGLMAIALLIIRYLDAMNDAGVGPALVQFPENPRYAASVGLTLSAISAIVLSVALFATAPLIAAFFGQPEVTALLRFLSPIFLLGAFSSIQSYWLQKNFRFAMRVLPETARSLAKAVAAISLALAGYGVWSLAIGQMLGQAAAALIYLFVSDLALKMAFDRQIAVRLINFGLQVSFVTLIGIFSKSLDQLVIGRYLEPADLGYYVLGAMVPELVIASICYTASQVFFPAFSRVQSKPRLLKASYLSSLKYVAMLTTPAGLGLALIAADFVDLAYSSVWAASIPVIWILSINASVQAFAFNAGDVFKATGRPQLLSKLSVLKIAISLPVLIFSTRYGIVGVALAQFLTRAAVVCVTLAIAGRLIDVTLRQFLRAVGKPLMAAGFMTAGCGALLFAAQDLAPIIRLPLVATLGVILYATALWYLDRHALLALLTKRHRKIKKRPLSFQ